MFKKHVERGMFARYEEGRWYAHADNIDDYLKVWTRVQMNKHPDKLDEEAF
jgi:hypothetical protein